MKIFRKLFGENAKRTDNIKPNNEKLISSVNINNSIIELDNYIAELCNYGDNLELLTEPQKVFYYIQCLERELNDGGFEQFYSNSSGDFAHEIIDALKAIGANKTADIVQKANDQFPGKIVPKDRDKRQLILEEIVDKTSEIWEELDQKFYEYQDNLNSLNMDYIKKHKDKF
jgi:hypothetical protein